HSRAGRLAQRQTHAGVQRILPSGLAAGPACHIHNRDNRQRLKSLLPWLRGFCGSAICRARDYQPDAL
ncbi:MAG: hypothetical protein VXW07_04840, partial [Pseudomonadota bacterium]|nr:hypothetical protein [Pseudomonadota bacterium]